MICTKLKNKLFNFRNMKYGVPQSSVLCPILFFLYVNDLPSVSKFETTLFADDTKLHLFHYNIETLQECPKSMNLNKLTINYKKSCYMIVR